MKTLPLPDFSKKPKDSETQKGSEKIATASSVANPPKKVEKKIPQGFLLPKEYKTKIAYEERVPFRLTLPAIIIFWIALGSFVPAWIFAKNEKDYATQIQTLLEEQNIAATAKLTQLKPIRSKYREIETLRKQLRIPLTPILDALEKTIPTTASINLINWTCDTTETVGKQKREATMLLEVYYPATTDPESAENTEWPTKWEELLTGTGALPVKAEWGQTSPADNGIGSVRPLSLSFQLD